PRSNKPHSGATLCGRYRVEPEPETDAGKESWGMVTIESTPEMAAKVYETMERNLAIVRRRLGRALTLADKVLLGHLDDPESADLVPGSSYLSLRPDRVILQDVLGQS